jgi:hypothetical protein
VRLHLLLFAISSANRQLQQLPAAHLLGCTSSLFGLLTDVLDLESALNDSSMDVYSSGLLLLTWLSGELVPRGWRALPGGDPRQEMLRHFQEYITDAGCTQPGHSQQELQAVHDSLAAQLEQPLASSGPVRKQQQAAQLLAVLAGMPDPLADYYLWRLPRISLAMFRHSEVHGARRGEEVPRQLQRKVQEVVMRFLRFRHDQPGASGSRIRRGAQESYSQLQEMMREPDLACGMLLRTSPLLPLALQLLCGFHCVRRALPGSYQHLLRSVAGWLVLAAVQLLCLPCSWLMPPKPSDTCLTACLPVPQAGHPAGAPRAVQCGACRPDGRPGGPRAAAGCAAALERGALQLGGQRARQDAGAAG